MRTWVVCVRYDHLVEAFPLALKLLQLLDRIALPENEKPSGYQRQPRAGWTKRSPGHTYQLLLE
jgi:hypothetical protein